MLRNEYTVSQVNRYVKAMLDSDVVLSDIFINGEISNFKAHSSGHFYFTLKDEKSSIDAIMYCTNAQSLDFMPKNGMKVTIYGYVSLYEKTGRYQVYVRIMEDAGKGAMYIAFERLKNKLEAEGIFDDEHKKPLPAFPDCIAVITSRTGAVLRDILNVVWRRNPKIQIVICPVTVQGESSADEVAGAIKLVNSWKKADVIILARGGGSIEDLWSFNEEKVARAIYASKLPVVSAIGHQTDFTIADFAADLRAPTPSAAAELVVPELDAVLGRFAESYYSLNNAAEYKIEALTNKLKSLCAKPFFQKPAAFAERLEDEILMINKRLVSGMKNNVALNLQRYHFDVKRLKEASPLNMLEKGYAIVSRGTDRSSIIKKIDEIKQNDELYIRLSNGEIKACVMEKYELNK